MNVTVSKILDEARSWVSKGCKEGSLDHKKILEIYNEYRPLARNYKVKVTDHWCMTFISMLFIRLSCVQLIGGTECSCQNAIEKMKKAGVWNEDGSVLPKPGDIIFYDWDATGAVHTTNGWADHVGIVESVKGQVITVIEGNYKDQVGRRTINAGWKFIRGYARPKYKTTLDDTIHNSPKKPIKEIAKEVIQGAWGVGAIRINNLKNAGYDPNEVQAEVNRQLSGQTNTASINQVAKEVIDGKWGNNPQRTVNLTKAGYDPVKVQEAVNRLVKG